MKLLSLSLVMIILFQTISSINTLQCAHDCLIDPVPFGSQDPIRIPCDTVDVDATKTVCSVFLMINFQSRQIDGALNEKIRELDQSLVLHVSSQFSSDVTRTFISYQCSTSDHCDEEFVRETISSSGWSELNETDVRTNISSLLFQDHPFPDDLLCNNDCVCPWFEQCVAELLRNSSVSQGHRLDFNNQFPCEETLDSHLEFNQYFQSPAATEDMLMRVFCNINDCNRRGLVELVYEILQEKFVIPLNYSAYTPTPAPRSHASDQKMSLFCIIGFLLFFYVYFDMTMN